MSTSTIATGSPPDEAGLLRLSLRSLHRLAQELETRIEAEREPVARLAVLAERPLPLGAFGEAFELSMCHLAVAGQMRDLLWAARDVACFACETARTIANRHDRFDTRAPTAHLATSGVPTRTGTVVGRPLRVDVDAAIAPFSAPPRTDFAAFDHATLLMMLHDSDPAAVAAAADTWASVGRGMYDRAGDIEREQRALDDIWQGDAATAYRAMIGDLVEGVIRTATVALAVRDIMYHVADALQEAWLTMPAAVDVRTVPPALAEAAEAHGRAVAVMTRLAGHDVAIEMATPHPPATIGPGVAIDGAVRLFGRVFGAGQAAIAATVAERLDALPVWIGRETTYVTETWRSAT